ncbi:MAG: hypothetical protein D3926_10100 [Desulfobacteraceae bacterium]|nr:MAG: hypothetical protein D3926_10100 [Desulfobacteraceae bacterium]
MSNYLTRTIVSILFVLSVSQLQARDRWTWELPKPQGNTINSIWAHSASDIFAVGDVGTILHISASGAVLMKSPTTSDLHDVFGFSASDVFAVGDDGVILHYDGSSWQQMTSPSPVELFTVWGTGNSKVFAAGRYGTILLYNGSTWVEMTAPSTMSHIKALWGTGLNNIWAVGTNGLAFYFNGFGWQDRTVQAGFGSTMSGLWATPGAVFFAVGSNRIYRYTEGSWIQETDPGIPLASFTDIWGTSTTEVYVTGYSGVVCRLDGSGWSEMTTGSTQSLYAVGGISGNDIYIAGSFGELMQKNNTAWTRRTQGDQYSIHAVWGSSNRDIWAVSGNGVILHSTGNGNWDVNETLPSTFLSDVWGLGPAMIWAVGWGLSGASVYQYTGSGWSSDHPANVSDVQLKGVWASSANNVYAAGYHYAGGSSPKTARIYRKTASGWSLVKSVPDRMYFGLWGFAANDIYAVGSSGLVSHYNGSSWTDTTIANAGYLYAAWGPDPDNIWVVGNSGAWQNQGSGWQLISDQFGFYLYDVYGTSANDLFMGGNSPEVIHWNTQSRSLYSPLARVSGIWAASRSQYWFVSSFGGIVRLTRNPPIAPVLNILMN